MNVHVIIGDDDYRVCEAARKIVGDGTGLEVIDSANSTNAEMQTADRYGFFNRNATTG